MKVALVHDYLNQFGGAERVLLALSELFPKAPIFTSIYNKENFPEAFHKLEIHTSFMQKLPNIFKEFRFYFPLYPKAFESFNLDDYDLIISSSSAYAKGVKKRPGAFHLCYCHTPARFLWRFEDYIEKEDIHPLLKRLLPVFLEGPKKWDLLSSEDVDLFVANSKVVRDRIKSIYHKESVIIYPPVDTDFYSIEGEKKGNYFLIVSRLVPYKRIDLAIDVFNKLGLPLKIIGDGPQKHWLKNRANENIEFLGKLQDFELRNYYRHTKALVFTGEEDLGLVPLEAAACGSPTIAFKKGGALETVVDKRTGIFFAEQKESSLKDAIANFDCINFDRNEIRNHALEFSKKRFLDGIRSLLNENKIF